MTKGDNRKRYRADWWPNTSVVCGRCLRAMNQKPNWEPPPLPLIALDEDVGDEPCEICHQPSP